MTLNITHRWILRGGAEAASAAGAAFGLGLPTRINRAEAGPDRAALKLGPDEWLLLASGPADFGAALAALPHSLVEISDRQVAIPLQGPGAALILNAVMPLDLHLDAFPVGMATRTVFERADVMLWRTGEQAFHIEVWRSFAPYVEGLIDLIARENAAA
ncbi:sarcosine oxidase subunit gamma [Phenylobacterium sp.]|uniref:sarcosine oxidase subunit gamma n=1 Tax=Phenylobacterium sp. TaxID=1871053 RepID=UPI0025E5A6E5|nr:sarcosine oxidase subunit gamma family protein [Phenylobacterium sp.]